MLHSRQLLGLYILQSNRPGEALLLYISLTMECLQYAHKACSLLVRFIALVHALADMIWAHLLRLKPEKIHEPKKRPSMPLE